MRRLHALAALILPMMVAGCGTMFDLQAHRGGRGLMPENTLPAFANAMRIGVSTLELDTAITRDGVVVVGHDPLLNPDIVRGADGRWLEKKGPAIHSLTFDELQAFDIGRLNPASAYAKRYPQQISLDGTRYSRLADLFEMVKRSGNTSIRFNIETKISPLEPDETVGPETFVDALLAVIRGAQMEGRVTLQSFDWRTLAIARRKAPSIPTVYLSAQQKFFDNIDAANPRGSAWTNGINVNDYDKSVARMVNAAGGNTWSPYFGDIDQATVIAARNLGLKVIPWTVNERQDIDRMLDWAVDGIISDYPDRVREAMTNRGMKLPAPQ